MWSWVESFHSSSMSVRILSCKQQKSTLVHLSRKGSYEKQMGSSEFLGWCGIRLRLSTKNNAPNWATGLVQWGTAATHTGRRPWDPAAGTMYVASTGPWLWNQTPWPLETKRSVTVVPSSSERSPPGACFCSEWKSRTGTSDRGSTGQCAWNLAAKEAKKTWCVMFSFSMREYSVLSGRELPPKGDGLNLWI